MLARILIAGGLIAQLGMIAFTPIDIGIRPQPPADKSRANGIKSTQVD